MKVIVELDVDTDDPSAIELLTKAFESGYPLLRAPFQSPLRNLFINGARLIGTGGGGWFVFRNATYYPDGTVVGNAESPEEALELMAKEGLTVDEKDGCAIFPMDAMARWIGTEAPAKLLDVI